MKAFFTTFPRNLIGCFKGRMIFWHLLAIILTFMLVRSGLDWLYFCHTRDPDLWHMAITSAAVGFFVPIAFPAALIISGYIMQRRNLALTGWAIAQAEIMGSLISSAYKAVTGRVHPEHTIGNDISTHFRFGWLQGGVFWGWPSSHTTIAFAMSVAIFTMFPERRWLRLLVLGYAFYIGIGVSMTIHWFSDFVAGANYWQCHRPRRRQRLLAPPTATRRDDRLIFLFSLWSDQPGPARTPGNFLPIARQGSTDDSSVPVGDPPTGTTARPASPTARKS